MVDGKGFMGFIEFIEFMGLAGLIPELAIMVLGDTGFLFSVTLNGLKGESSTSCGLELCGGIETGGGFWCMFVCGNVKGEGKGEGCGAGATTVVVDLNGLKGASV